VKNPKRAIKHAVLFALIGMVMSYGVAWGCLFPQRWFLLGPSPEGGKVVEEGRTSAILIRFTHSLGVSFCYSCPSTDRPYAQSLGLVNRPYWHEHLWWQLESDFEGFRSTSWVAAGFPLRCCRGGFVNDLDPVMSRGLILLSEGPNPGRICFEPYFPGLLINTAFYGAILWLLWLTPGMLRRGSRRRRGLCVRCGYDLRGSQGSAVSSGGGGACPECGAA
jgi:hypothetical protein